MKNFKAFFRWVYVEILRLSDETVSGDLSKVGLLPPRLLGSCSCLLDSLAPAPAQVSQQDITFIAEFLKRFQPVESRGGSVSHLYLEKVSTPCRKQPNETGLYHAV